MRLTLFVLLVCLTGIAVGYTMHDEADGTYDSDSDQSHDTDRGLDLRNGTCLEKAERLLRYLWARYKLKHHKRFSHTEEHRRIAIFKALLERLHVHNMEADMGIHTFHVGLNSLSDLTPKEFSRMKGFLANTKRSSENEFRASMPLSALPSSVDWRPKGWVTPVKNQGQCGSCYTFASTGAMEGQLMNKTNQLTSLSEQNLVDCSTSYGNMGCNGGVTDWAFQYVKQNGGINTETSYPYTGRQGSCKYRASNAVPGAKVKSWVDVQRGSETSLMQAVATIGPTTVAIDASQSGFQSYTSGIYTCKSSPQLDHAVLVVGYDSSAWIVKNSWGTGWGDGGYIRIARGNNVANCGITNQASVPVM